MSLANKLSDNVIKSISTGKPTNKSLDRLVNSLHEFVSSNEAKDLLEKADKAYQLLNSKTDLYDEEFDKSIKDRTLSEYEIGKKEVEKNALTKEERAYLVCQEYIPLPANLRIATLDLASLVDTHEHQSPEYLKITENYPHIGGDGARRQQSASPPIRHLPQDIQENLITYLRTILNGELKEIAGIALKAVGTHGWHKAIISLDYYSDRVEDTPTLHKDTTGNTLFVALHFINSNKMLGPEYRYDKWPIAAKDVTLGQKTYAPKTPDDVVQTEKKRNAAPWRFDRSAKSEQYKPDKKIKYYYWPTRLLQALNQARLTLPNENKLYDIELDAYGLVYFVDELIYHTTPFPDHRKGNGLFSSTTISGAKLDFPNYGGLERTISEKLNIDKKKLPPMTDSKSKRGIFAKLNKGKKIHQPTTDRNSKRRFVRLWISIVPAHWYKPLNMGLYIPASDD